MRSSAEEWIGSLSPWPTEFGLDRMKAVLAKLGDPQLAYESIHVVGTNGKSTATRTIEALLAREGLHVGAYVSPHVRRWSERIRVNGEEADFEQALGAVREAAEALGATQFEALTAAALCAFADAGVDAAVVEAGLGGRLDATNVLRSPVQLLTNVALDHTDVLGETREAIAAEKLAVVQPGSTVVVGEAEWAEVARANGAARVVVGGAREAAEAFLGRALTDAAVDVSLPGRLERHGNEVWDGAHNVAGVEWLIGQLPRDDYVVCASILADKDAGTMLRLLATLGRTLVATASSNRRALPASELARLAEPHFDTVVPVPDPGRALERARALAGSGGVLVTGSLYLLSDLAASEAAEARCTLSASA